jgi:hydrogenase maturation protein HypF
LGVQHHHAHLAACLAENGLQNQVFGIILDGTGYGPDQTIWGGEILVGDLQNYQRRACFEPMPLPGGEAAIREPWRIGTAYLYKTFGKQLPDLVSLKHRNTDVILEMIDRELQTPLTSSCGRLFDAVAAISGGRQTIRYEAQAAIEFMQAAGMSLGSDATCFDLSTETACWQLSVTHIMQTLIQRIRAGKSMVELSRWFHHSLILTFLAVAERLRRETALNTIVLSGGVFQNRLLFEGLLRKLEEARFSVITHRQVPTNDGGIALGQASIGMKSCQT